jgi:cell wall-associated NlpC family hydrolase
VALVGAGCGSSTHQPAASGSDAAASEASGGAPGPSPAPGSSGSSASTQVPQAHPQAIEPIAGKGTPAPSGSDPAIVSVGSSSGSRALAQPVSDAVIRQELAASGLSANASQATLTPSGLAIPPANAPWAVQEVIGAGNEIAHLPYRFGGGHGTFEDSAYDCSGSLSFVFAAAGLLNTTVTSGQLMNWGRPGPGKWITVFASPGHTFMYVAGLRFDTVALAETGSRWSNRSADEPDLHSFAVRHPVGL